MKLLIIGGTVFVGRHLVNAARARGHQVTLLNRGKSRPGVFEDVETIHGDRQDAELWASLRGRTWDAVIDTCGYVPRVVRQSADALKDAVGQYVFISTISVFRDMDQVGMTEDAPLGTLAEDTEAVTGETYGPLKVQCEAATQYVYGDRALIIRPGFIVGPYDPTDRFTYWPYRVSLGSDVLCPGSPDAPIQFIDARDLADFTLALMERGTGGIFNATGPDYRLTWGKMLEICRDVTQSDARFVWMPDDELKAREVEGLPLYAPATGPYAGLMTVNVDKAIASGLTFRPLAETIQDTLTWNRQRDLSTAFQKAISREKEAEVLTGFGNSGQITGP